MTGPDGGDAELDLIPVARRAAYRALRVYPGPVGAVVAEELEASCEFGWRFGGADRMLRLARDVLDRPIKEAV